MARALVGAARATLAELAATSVGPADEDLPAIPGTRERERAEAAFADARGQSVVGSAIVGETIGDAFIEAASGLQIVRTRAAITWVILAILAILALDAMAWILGGLGVIEGLYFN